MKVLYISSGKGEDYQRDVLFHGLRELLGEDAVDAGRIDSLYRQPDEAKHAMYGRGYTVYADLPDIPVDREDLAHKIRGRFFDLVIYGSVHRCRDHLPRVLEAYPPGRVLFIDGEDSTHIRWRLLGKGIYFKRELEQALLPHLQPIHFAVPAAKFVDEQQFEDNLQRKTALFAPCDPRDRSTYRFLSETAYYQQYREARFGVTMKKAGWDCMRHHEIAAQGTAPYFLDLEQCPQWTLRPLPRPLLLQLRGLAETPKLLESAPGRARYDELLRSLFACYRQRFTTAALAQQVLEVAAALADLDRARPRSWPLEAQRLRRQGKGWAEAWLSPLARFGSSR